MKKNITRFALLLAAAALSVTACTCSEGEKTEGAGGTEETTAAAAVPETKPEIQIPPADTAGTASGTKAATAEEIAASAKESAAAVKDAGIAQRGVFKGKSEEKIIRLVYYDTVRVYVYEDKVRWVERPVAESVPQDDPQVVVPDQGDSEIGEPEQEKPWKRSRFMPMTHRVDRHIDAVKFAYKKEWAVGLTVSYATLNSDDTDFMLLLDDVTLKGSYFKINPSVGYFVRDNLCVGLRFGYNNMTGSIDNMTLDLGSSNDISTSLTNVSLKSRATTYSAFLRQYVGIDPKSNFGLFGELEFSIKNGMTDFKYEPVDADHRYLSSKSLQFKGALHCGLAVYLMPNVCATLSFGFGGIQYNRVRQMDPNGVVIGTRNASQMKFKLNVTDIRIGFNIHL